MSYDIERKRIRPQPIAFATGRSAATGVPALLGELLPRAMQYAQQNGGKIIGPPFTRYLSMGETLELQAGVPLEEEIEPGDGVEIGHLPGGDVLTTVHIGPFDKLPEAYQAMARHVQEEGLPAEGSIWEYYWTDPEEEPDPAKWRTEIFLNLEG